MIGSVAAGGARLGEPPIPLNNIVNSPADEGDAGAAFGRPNSRGAGGSLLRSSGRNLFEKSCCEGGAVPDAAGGEGAPAEGPNSLAKLPVSGTELGIRDGAGGTNAGAGGGGVLPPCALNIALNSLEPLFPEAVGGGDAQAGAGVGEAGALPAALNLAVNPPVSCAWDVLVPGAAGLGNSELVLAGTRGDTSVNPAAISGRRTCAVLEEDGPVARPNAPGGETTLRFTGATLLSQAEKAAKSSTGYVTKN